MADNDKDETVIEPIIESKYQSPLNKMAEEYKPKNGGDTNVDELTGIDLSVYSDLSEDDIKNLRTLKGKDLTLKVIEKANDHKKWQRLADERLKEIDTFKSQKPDEKIQKYETFINDLKKDFFGTYNKYSEEFGLPDASYMRNQLQTGGSIEDRLQQYQETELKDKIEKEFKLEAGTFVFDRDEALQPKTPSYRFRTLSEDKEKELKGEYELSQKKIETALNNMIVERDSQLKRLRETFYPTDKSYESEKDETKKNQLKLEAEKKADDAYRAKLAELDTAYNKAKEGDFTAKGNPLAVENMFKGYFFGELTDQAVRSAVDAVHKAYKEKGIYIKAEDMPQDLASIKGENLPDLSNPQTNKYVSPMSKMINKYKT